MDDLGYLVSCGLLCLIGWTVLFYLDMWEHRAIQVELTTVDDAYQSGIITFGEAIKWKAMPYGMVPLPSNGAMPDGGGVT